MSWDWKMQCPHCGVYSQISERHGPGRANAGPRIAECVSCGQCIYMHLSPDKLIDYYPKRLVRPDPAIPEGIAADFAEAAKCLDASAYPACATMCRRTTQVVAVDKQAEGARLYDQIEDLTKKAIVTPPLKDWAHEVRLIGKAGAHADEPEDVEASDAQDAFAFTEELLQHVYVMPAKIAKRRGLPAPPNETQGS